MQADLLALGTGFGMPRPPRPKAAINRRTPNVGDADAVRLAPGNHLLLGLAVEPNVNETGRSDGHLEI